MTKNTDEKKGMNFGSIHNKGTRANRLYKYLMERRDRWITSLTICQQLDDTCPATTVSELRKNGVKVECERQPHLEREGRRKVYGYKIIEGVPDGEGISSDSNIDLGR